MSFFRCPYNKSPAIDVSIGAPDSWKPPNWASTNKAKQIHTDLQLCQTPFGKLAPVQLRGASCGDFRRAEAIRGATEGPESDGRGVYKAYARPPLGNSHPVTRGLKDHKNIRISRSGSKAPWKLDTRNHDL